MSKEAQKSNFELAQEEANKIDLQIIDTLQKGYNFRVEAGAGSGKTYSLNKVIEWIQVNKWKQYRKKNQHVVCITYTNAAVDRSLNKMDSLVKEIMAVSNREIFIRLAINCSSFSNCVSLRFRNSVFSSASEASKYI